VRVTFGGLSGRFLLCFCSMRDCRLLVRDGKLGHGIRFRDDGIGGLPFIICLFLVHFIGV